jgi:hypothetical protein
LAGELSAAPQSTLDRETSIRRRAYELWEHAGRPTGRALEHWLAAENEYIGMESKGFDDPAVAGRSSVETPHQDHLRQDYGDDTAPETGPPGKPGQAVSEAPADVCLTRKVNTPQGLPLSRPVSDN